jgi:hypothetical protein
MGNFHTNTCLEKKTLLFYASPPLFPSPFYGEGVGGEVIIRPTSVSRRGYCFYQNFQPRPWRGRRTKI